MKKCICLLSALIILLSIVPLSVFADEKIDLNKEGSITVKVIEEGVALKDMMLTCIKVANVELNNGFYEFVGIYERIRYTKENLNDSDFPGKVLKYVQDNISHFKKLNKRVDSKGIAEFNGLKPGLYLIYQSEAYTQNGTDYTKINPFVVTIPYKGKYKVDATSKPSLDAFPTEPPTSPSKPSRLPQTGQLNWPVPVLASGGMLLFALGWWLVFSSRKDSSDA